MVRTVLAVCCMLLAGCSTPGGGKANTIEEYCEGPRGLARELWTLQHDQGFSRDMLLARALHKHAAIVKVAPKEAVSMANVATIIAGGNFSNGLSASHVVYTLCVAAMADDEWLSTSVRIPEGV